MAVCHFYYANLLRKAHEANDQVERMKWVSAFAASMRNDPHWKWLKFLGVVGETYELTRFDFKTHLFLYNFFVIFKLSTARPDLGFRVLTEIISYNPHQPVCHADSVDR